MLPSDNARTGSASPSRDGLVLDRIAKISASTSEGFSLSSRIEPNGAGSRCPLLRLAYNTLVDSLRSDAAKVVARQCFNQSPTVLLASLTGAPASSRSRASFILARAAFAVGP
jgi:hypothetical protein